MPSLSMHSPIGDLTLFEDAGAIVALDWGWVPEQTPSPLLERAKMQLEAYFDGARIAFSLPLAPEGTPLRRRIWAAIAAIPYGTTATYGALAGRLGTTPRVVGGASAANPIPLLIPCHRLVGSDGALVGYSGPGGIATKAAILRLEGALLDL